MPPNSRDRLCGSEKSGPAAGTGKVVNEGGTEFAGSRGWFIGKCGHAVGEFLRVAILVLVVVTNIAWLGAVARVCRRRVLGVGVRGFALDGADHGAARELLRFPFEEG